MTANAADAPPLSFSTRLGLRHSSQAAIAEITAHFDIWRLADRGVRFVRVSELHHRVGGTRKKQGLVGGPAARAVVARLAEDGEAIYSRFGNQYAGRTVGVDVGWVMHADTFQMLPPAAVVVVADRTTADGAALLDGRVEPPFVADAFDGCDPPVDLFDLAAYGTAIDVDSVFAWLRAGAR